MTDTREIKEENVELFVKEVYDAKEGKKFGAIITTERGRINVPKAMVKDFYRTKGTVIKVDLATGEARNGFPPFVHITAKRPAPLEVPKDYVRPATNPQDSDRMATMGMVNATLHAAGLTLSEFLTLPKGMLAKVIDRCSDELHMSRLHGQQAQRRDDMNDELPDFAPKSEDPAEGMEEVPF